MRKQSKELSKKCYNDYINKVENSICKDTKYFWTYVNSYKQNSGIPTTLIYQNRELLKNDEILERFKHYFESVYTAPTQHNIVLPELENNIHFSTFQIDIKDIHKKILNLDNKKGPGPDKIPNKFIKNCNLSLA